MWLSAKIYLIYSFTRYYNNPVRHDNFKFGTLFPLYLFVFMKVNPYKYVKTMILI